MFSTLQFILRPIKQIMGDSLTAKQTETELTQLKRSSAHKTHSFSGQARFYIQ